MDTLFYDVWTKRRRKPLIHLQDIQHNGEKKYFFMMC